MKKWTKKEWEHHVLANCHDSYSLIVCAAALLVKETRGKKDFYDVLRDNINGLTVFQGESVKALARYL